MPFPLFAVIISRDLGLILSSLYIRYKIIDEPKTFTKYINLKKYASVKVEADSISKFNTAVQVALISLTLPSVMLGYSDSTMLVYLQWFTGFTTALSAGSYLYKRGSYKLR
jgi:cardiolipin synthase